MAKTDHQGTSSGSQPSDSVLPNATAKPGPLKPGDKAEVTAIQQRTINADADVGLVTRAAASLSRAAVELLRREPFFGHILGGIPRHFTEKITTMAVGLRGDAVQLLINPRFILEELIRREDRVAVLKHEVLHIVFKHLFRTTDRRQCTRIWNIAADLVVNQYVPPFQLPDGAILLSSFPDAHFSSNEAVEVYYDALIRLQENGKRRFGASPLGSAALDSMLSGNLPSDHSYWATGNASELDMEPTGAAVPSFVRELLSEAIDDQILRAHARTIAGRGTVPEWMERVVGELTERRKPRVNWQRTLRLFASSGQRTRMIITSRRESKRFESIAGAGRVAGLMVKRYQRIAVIIDTSGSVGQVQLQMFFAEIRGISRQGAEIVVVECDSEVRRSYPYKGRTPEIVRGGGGTSFEPALRWLREQREQRFDACVYLTDGEGSAPETKPPCPLLWVIVDGTGGDHLRFGRQMLLEGC